MRKLGGTRLHTRTIIRDRRQAFVGSQSLRTAELDSRRELGLIVQDAKAVKKLMDTFESDWASSSAKKSRADLREKEIPATEPAVVSEKQADTAVKVFTKELDPLTTSVKKAVRKAVAKAGDDVLHDKEVKDTHEESGQEGGEGKPLRKRFRTCKMPKRQSSKRNSFALNSRPVRSRERRAADLLACTALLPGDLMQTAASCRSKSQTMR